jgi:uncharacterized protein (UPF0179 family)
MVIITLIGERQAKQGYRFIYKGPLTDCRDCRLKAVCFNLDAGGEYRIKELRDVHHDCRIHEDGVRVVEVEKMPVDCAIQQKMAIDGSTITYDEVRCNNMGCRHYRLCHPHALVRNSKYRVAKVLGDVKCPEGHRLIRVELQ